MIPSIESALWISEPKKTEIEESLGQPSRCAMNASGDRRRWWKSRSRSHLYPPTPYKTINNQQMLVKMMKNLVIFRVLAPKLLLPAPGTFCPVISATPSKTLFSVLLVKNHYYFSSLL
ncbi:hypothetical protein Hanom_Chr16g01458531 [Helianthus anomalus]